MTDNSFDVVIIGSGFGGSVTALRLTEKGYRVAVLESGRRFARKDFAKTSWDSKNYTWAPYLGMRGIMRYQLLNDVLVASGAGVGGGSLVYANTLYEPLDAFYDDPQWCDITDWRTELAPHYRQAQAMLGVTTARDHTPADNIMRQLAEEMGVADTFHPTQIGVFLGPRGKTVPDPYFGGVGPDKVGCTECGACMTGCKVGAKNTLDTNYLYLAEQAGATVFPDTEASDIVPLADGSYEITTKRPGTWRNKKNRTFRGAHVVLSASSLGTQRLLHRLRDEGRLPDLSDRLGYLSRTNSESITTAIANNTDIDYSEGVAITSSIHIDENTHIEPVRFGPGSNSNALLGTVMVDGGGRVPRWIRWLGAIATQPRTFLRTLDIRRWSERSIILLVMQAHDNSLRVYRKKGLFGTRLATTQGHGAPNPTWLPVANEAARRAARLMGGIASSSSNEAVLNRPTTAHFIGGCSIGTDPEHGVIDPYHRVFGYPGMHVIDGASVTANLGVNPSLTITAMAERATSMWPNKGETDARPPLGDPYERLEPVSPNDPAVPAHAPAALQSDR